MLPSPTSSPYREIVKRLVDAANPRKIILFGSRARGTAGPDSDIDLLVVENQVQSKHLEMVRLRRSLKGISGPFDVLVVSEQEFSQRKNLPNNVCQWADSEGVVLYDVAG